MVFSCQSELNKAVLLKLLCSGGWVLILCICVLCRESQSLVRDLWLSLCKMRRGNTCQDMSLMEEICFLQWDILWVAECTIIQMWFLWFILGQCYDLRIYSIEQLNKWWTGKDLVGRGCDLLTFSWRDWGKPWKTSGCLASCQRFELGTYGIQV